MPKVTFKSNRIQTRDHTVEASEGMTIQQVALENNLPIGDACGGVCACSTCHCYIESGLDNLSPMEEDEDDRLDQAFDVHMESRLGCQAIIQGELIVRVTEEGLDAFLNERPHWQEPT